MPEVPARPADLLARRDRLLRGDDADRIDVDVCECAHVDTPVDAADACDVRRQDHRPALEGVDAVRAPGGCARLGLVVADADVDADVKAVRPRVEERAANRMLRVTGRDRPADGGAGQEGDGRPGDRDHTAAAIAASASRRGHRSLAQDARLGAGAVDHGRRRAGQLAGVEHRGDAGADLGRARRRAGSAPGRRPGSRSWPRPRRRAEHGRGVADEHGTRTPIVSGRAPVSQRKRRRAGSGARACTAPGSSARAIRPLRPRSSGTHSKSSSRSRATSAIGLSGSRPLSRDRRAAYALAVRVRAQPVDGVRREDHRLAGGERGDDVVDHASHRVTSSRNGRAPRRRRNGRSAGITTRLGTRDPVRELRGADRPGDEVLGARDHERRRLDRRQLRPQVEGLEDLLVEEPQRVRIRNLVADRVVVRPLGLAVAREVEGQLARDEAAELLVRREVAGLLLLERRSCVLVPGLARLPAWPPPSRPPARPRSGRSVLASTSRRTRRGMRRRVRRRDDPAVRVPEQVELLEPELHAQLLEVGRRSPRSRTRAGRRAAASRPCRAGRRGSARAPPSPARSAR